MNRLLCLALMVVAGSCGVARSANPPAARRPVKPNIVILLADDLGWGDVGYHGGQVDTPHIDRLAREGVQLENFHSCPLCSPTRAGLMTGRWPIRYGMAEAVITPWRQWGLPTTERTIADLLATAGYERRGVFGKWHLGHYKKRYLPLRRGFTSFYGHYNGALDYFTHVREGQLDWHRNDQTCRDQGYSTDLIAREAIRFINESPAGKPFFCYVPFNAPHMPLEAKEQDIAKYRTRIADRRRRIYAAMIDCLDQNIGRILKAIDDKGIAENTLVWFLSDNGAISLGDNGPWRGHKGQVYEGGVRVPSVIRWPAGLPGGGRKCDAMMGYIDVYPTLKRVAGITAPDPNPLDGIDVLDIVCGRARPPQRHWFSFVAQGTPDRTALCDGVWKVVVPSGNVLQIHLDQVGKAGAANTGPAVELYDLVNGADERTDVVEKHPDIARRLLEQARALRRVKLDVPDFREGRQHFVAPKDWVITQE